MVNKEVRPQRYLAYIKYRQFVSGLQIAIYVAALIYVQVTQLHVALLPCTVHQQVIFTIVNQRTCMQ